MLTERDDAPGTEPVVNEDARPDGGAAPPANPAAALPPDAPGAEARPADPDDALLAAARAEERAERSGTAPEAPSETGTQPPAAQNQSQQRQIMVPKARFDEVVARARNLEQQVLMAHGALQVLTKQGQQPAGAAPQDAGGAPPAQAPQATAQQQIEALDAEILAAADKFDAGEMTLAEFKRVESGHTRQIASIREADLLARMPQPQQGPSLADQAITRNFLSDLYAKHPYAAGLNDQQASNLAAIAAAEFAAEGHPLGTGAVETMRLQARVAALSDRYGRAWGVTPSQTTAAQSQPAATGGAGMSPQAQARANKLALSASLPPDTASLGAGAAGDDAITDARIETMSDEEILALPPSVRARFHS